MKIYFTCFSDVKFLHFRKKLCRKAKRLFDGVFEYDQDDFLVKTEFYKANANIVKHKWCGWKPFIILETLSEINDGDVVFYMDCGCSFESRLVAFLRNHFVENDTFLLGSVFQNRRHTKHDCFHLMGCDGDKYKDTAQLTAGVCGFKKTEAVTKILEEWLYYCQDEKVMMHSPNTHGENDPAFVKHGGDQSVLTNLAIKHGLDSCPPGHEAWGFVKCHANRVCASDSIRELGYPHNIMFGGSG